MCMFCMTSKSLFQLDQLNASYVFQVVRRGEGKSLNLRELRKRALILITECQWLNKERSDDVTKTTFMKLSNRLAYLERIR